MERVVIAFEHLTVVAYRVHDADCRRYDDVADANDDAKIKSDANANVVDN